jgi:mRNA deadenylase 3'-5' endonuclease subunit Ccr4
MKKLIISCFIMVTALLNAQDMTIMTYNIKLDYPKEGENSWTNRKPFFINQLQFYEPDIFGVQEAMPNQMKDIDSLLID